MKPLSMVYSYMVLKKKFVVFQRDKKISLTPQYHSSMFDPYIVEVTLEYHIRDLMSLGFAENEAKAYLNLLNRNYSAAELSSVLNVNRTNVYKTINKLIEKGFCNKLTETSTTISQIIRLLFLITKMWPKPSE